MPLWKGLFTMPPKVSGEKVCKCKEWPGKFMENLISQKSGRLPWIFRSHKDCGLILAEYARLNFASKKPAPQQGGHHVKHLNLLCSTLIKVKPDKTMFEKSSVCSKKSHKVEYPKKQWWRIGSWYLLHKAGAMMIPLSLVGRTMCWEWLYFYYRHR